MIEFPREVQHTIPSSLVKVIGLGGAGANMLDRVALDGLDGAEILALNADVRTLAGSVASERIQLGRNLTKGLGCGGDPDLGKNVTLEAESEIRMSIKGRKIIFLCVGLGGGTGSGGAPVVCRIAREEDAFVVVFATMPFTFEGKRRLEQAQTALNELAVLSNALVVFENNRMGSLVLAKQGIHEAFQAGDQMISDSIKAVIRLVTRPGLIHVGLDDLMTALRSTRSRCLFGSGVASGNDRASKALNNALASPLLDKGVLLHETASLLVHICGGSDLTLYEVELLMQKLTKQVPEKAHVLFGAAIDESMNDRLSITIISSLPEEKLQEPTVEEAAEQKPLLEPTEGFGFEATSTESEPMLKAEPQPILAQFSFDSPNVTSDQSQVVPSEAQELESTAPPVTKEKTRIPPRRSSFAEPEAHSSTKTSDLLHPFAEPLADDMTLPADFTSIVPSIVNPAAQAAAEIRDADPVSTKVPATDSKDLVAPEKESLFASPEISKIIEKTRSKRMQDELLSEKEEVGRFSGVQPTVEDGDNLDIPPFLRKKKK